MATGRPNGLIAAVSALVYAGASRVDTWLSGSRGDLPKIDVRAMLVNGDADRVLPYQATAKRLPDLLRSGSLAGISMQSLDCARRTC